MELDDLRLYCLAKPGTTEELPFDEHTLVFKVVGKMFAATNLSEPESRVNLKCDPEKALELREQYDAIIPGYHMNKKHWNTVYLKQNLKSKLIIELIDHSYDLVVSKLPKRLRSELENLS